MLTRMRTVIYWLVAPTTADTMNKYRVFDERFMPKLLAPLICVVLSNNIRAAVRCPQPIFHIYAMNHMIAASQFLHYVRFQKITTYFVVLVFFNSQCQRSSLDQRMEVL